MSPKNVFLLISAGVLISTPPIPLSSLYQKVILFHKCPILFWLQYLCHQTTLRSCASHLPWKLFTSFSHHKRTGMNVIFIWGQNSFKRKISLLIPTFSSPFLISALSPRSALCTWYFVVTENVTLFAPSFSFKLACQKEIKKYRTKWNIDYSW